MLCQGHFIVRPWGGGYGTTAGVGTRRSHFCSLSCDGHQDLQELSESREYCAV